MNFASAMALVSAGMAFAIAGNDFAKPASGFACDLLTVCHEPETCPAMSETPPAKFSVTFETTAGNFTVTTVTAWAPPYAKRFWQLSRIGYMDGAPFYRVDRINATTAWVVQFGYRGEPDVDKCWEDKRTDNTTWSVHKPGNVRGTVAFSMNAAPPSPLLPNCTSEQYCAQGFSTNIFINYANNTRLDAPGFSVFGYIEAGGMRVVDRLYAEYGEVSDLCGGNSAQKSAAGSTFCNGHGDACKGVSMSRLLNEGHAYWSSERPKLDSILSVTISKHHPKMDDGIYQEGAEKWMSYEDGEDEERGDRDSQRRGKRELLRLLS
jgi:cyclophilin family peptidyl-prolyl cis-trans isomerase